MEKDLTSLPDLLEELEEKGIDPDGVVIDRRHIKTLEPIDDEDLEN